MNNTLVYDISSLPENLSIDEILEIIEEHNIVLYDSSKGTKPSFVGKVDNVKIIKSNTKTGTQLVNKLKNN